MTTQAPFVTGVDFVYLPTRNFEAAVEFYGTLLRLPCVAKYGERPGGEFEAGNLTLQVLEAEAFGPRVSAQQESDCAPGRGRRGRARGARDARHLVRGGHVGQRRLPHGVLQGSGRERPHAPPPLRAADASGVTAGPGRPERARPHGTCACGGPTPSCAEIRLSEPGSGATHLFRIHHAGWSPCRGSRSDPGEEPLRKAAARVVKETARQTILRSATTSIASC
jgi:hypothetical protein